MLACTSLKTLTLSLAFAATAWAGPAAKPTPSEFDLRERDWRNGAIVYQVIVDRFVPSANLEAKRGLYPPPKVLRPWSEPSQRGVYLESEKLNSQELDFWGGDLASLATKVGYVQQLGADVLYLNPIHLAYTNHKYDALDFQQISPEYGTRADFKRLAAQAHQLGLKVVLDGVFNHMGRNAPRFKSAMAEFEAERAPSGGGRAAAGGTSYRDWFAIGPQYEGGARVWTGFQNLPELNLENPAVRRYLYEAPDSVLRSYLRDGADGWRLDTAFELGHRYLADLTRAAHTEKPGSLVVGEIVNYPGDWLRDMDAVMNFSLRQIVLGAASGEIAPAMATRMTERLVRDAGIAPILKSWMVIDNHDIPRIATQLPKPSQRRLVQALQFTLPGAPNIYYGAELGMVGGGDPENRGPMRWDLAEDANPDLVWMKQLIAMRKQQRALRVGNFRTVESERLYAFERHTDKALETVVVLANPTSTPVTERVMIANPSLLDGTPMVNLLDASQGADAKPVGEVGSGFMTVTLPPETVWVLSPRLPRLGGYNRFKRVR